MKRGEGGQKTEIVKREGESNRQDDDRRMEGESLP